MKEWFVMPDVKLRTSAIDMVNMHPGSTDLNYPPRLDIVTTFHKGFVAREALYAIEALHECGFYTITEHLAAKMRMTRYIQEFQQRVRDL